MAMTIPPFNAICVDPICSPLRIQSKMTLNIIDKLDGEIEYINKERLSKLTYVGHKKISRIVRKSALIAF